MKKTMGKSSHSFWLTPNGIAAIALIGALRNTKCKLVISHESGDEGQDYHDALIYMAERANVGTVLLGSFMRSGDTIRISVKVQEAASGKILASRDVRGEGQSRLFAMVDDLSRGIRQELLVSDASDAQEDRYLEDVTTSSIEEPVNSSPKT